MKSILTAAALVVVVPASVAAERAQSAADATVFIRLVGSIHADIDEAGLKRTFDQDRVEIGTGSGFVISPFGYVITNDHVISNSELLLTNGIRKAKVTIKVSRIDVCFPARGGPAQKLIDGFFRGDWIERPGGGGTWIVTSNNSNSVRVIDVEKRAIAWEERVAGSPSSMPVVSPDGHSISVAVQEHSDRRLEISNRAPSADAVVVLDLTTHKQHVAARLPFRIIFRAAWTDGGSALIVNRNDSTSRIVMFDRFWDSGNR